MSLVEEHTFSLSLNFPQLQFLPVKNGNGACLLELLHQLNEIICNVLLLINSQQMVLFSLDNAFIDVLQ